jgi:hypothetical protein
MDNDEKPLPGSKQPDEDGPKPSHDEFEGELIEEHLSDGDSGHHRKKRRIKIRKRVRIKRKSSPKKKARKMLETVAWVLIVAAFIVTLVVLVLQLDLNTKVKKKGGQLLKPVTEQLIDLSHLV